MHSDCLFCSLPKDRVIAECELAFVIRDGFPVTAFHTLVLPKRHVKDYFALTDSELMAIHRHVVEQRKALLRLDSSIEGFNIGANCGEVSGQTIWHCHLHLIPRRRGDVEVPRGGVRHVIPGKGAY